MRFQFTFTLTEKDLFMFTLYHDDTFQTSYKKRLALKARILMSLFAGSMMFVLLSLFSFYVENDDITFRVVIIGASLITIIIIFIMYPLLMVEPNERAKYKNFQLLKKLGRLVYDKEVIFSFYDDEYTEITPDSSSNIRYSMIEKVCAGREGVYLYQTMGSAWIIPNTAFQNPEERGAFVAFLRDRITTV